MSRLFFLPIAVAIASLLLSSKFAVEAFSSALSRSRHLPASKTRTAHNVLLSSALKNVTETEGRNVAADCDDSSSSHSSSSAAEIVTRLTTNNKAKPEEHDQSQEWLVDRVKSVNYFISRKCNYHCKFCFHTQKTTHTLPIEDAIRGLELLKEAGTQKINFAGGEPFIRPHLLGKLCIAAHGMGMAVSIISNGSLITEEWMNQYGHYVDVLGVSVDSFDPVVNGKIGRGGDANNKHVERMMNVRRWCYEHGIKFKINTVVCKYNWKENMSEQIQLLNPVRWKIFQVLILAGENAGSNNSGGDDDLRDATKLTVSDDQYQAFVDRHRPRISSEVLIPESNDVMQNSYLLLDEELRFLDCSDGGKIPSESILDVGVEIALSQAGFDYEMFQKRGGIFDWTRDREGTDNNRDDRQLSLSSSSQD